MRRIFLAYLLLGFVAVAFAQKTQKVTATYTYYAPDNVTLEEAKRTALDRAKISSIADAFGTIVTQSNSTITVNENGKSDSRFFSLGGSDVKGEWLETTKEPIYKISYEGNMLVVSVEVSGVIKEIVSSGIDIIAKILRNGTEEKFESSEFRDGDDMYLYFKSPVDGYLVVYLLDEATQEVYCLLPYKASGEGAYRIEHDRPYILFSSKFASDNPEQVDEYTLTCSQQTEFDDLYVIFSASKFVKANSQIADNSFPKQLSYKDFKKWLGNTTSKDINVVVVEKQIMIKQ